MKPAAAPDAYAFERKLKRAHLSIVKEAASRTCGDCGHAGLTSSGIGHCTLFTNYEGGALEIYRRAAVACRKFAPL